MTDAKKRRAEPRRFLRAGRDLRPSLFSGGNFAPPIPFKPLKKNARYGIMLPIIGLYVRILHFLQRRERWPEKITAPKTSGYSKGWTRCACVPVCTSVRRARRVCTTFFCKDIAYNCCSIRMFCYIFFSCPGSAFSPFCRRFLFSFTSSRSNMDRPYFLQRSFTRGCILCSHSPFG